jgi:hypothetical protein
MNSDFKRKNNKIQIFGGRITNPTNLDGYTIILIIDHFIISTPPVYSFKKADYAIQNVSNLMLQTTSSSY